MSKECAALASDDSRLSNTGVVSFDLQVCLNYVGVADDGEPRCELPGLGGGPSEGRGVRVEARGRLGGRDQRLRSDVERHKGERRCVSDGGG